MSHAPDPDDPLAGVDLLRSVAPGSDPALDALVAEARATGDAFAAAALLRGAGFAPERAAAALSQAELRATGTAKLGERAAGMLLTRAGLEQATRWQVAELHGRLLAAAGIEQVTDVGCGLGADTWALTRHVPAVTALEADAETAAAAAHNLAGTGAVVEHREVDASWQPPAAPEAARCALWFDPARRTGVADARGRARRVSGPTGLRPSLELVTTLAGRVGLTGCKVGPGWRHGDVPAGAHAQWVSHDGDLVEAVLWMGRALASPGGAPDPLRPVAGAHSATRLDHDGTVLAHTDSTALPPSPAGMPGHRVLTSEDELGTHLWEPDPALAQAGLVGVVAGGAAEARAAELGTGVGWMTADLPGDPAWVRTHRVVEVMAPRPKVLSAWARRREVGELVLRKHGSSLDPAVVRQRIRTRGDQRRVLLLTRIGDRQVAVETEAPAEP